MSAGSNASAAPHGIAWGKVGGAVVVLGAGFVIGYATGGSSEPPRPREHARIDPARTQQGVPTYDRPAPPVAQRAALTPNLGGAAQEPERKAATARGGKTKPEKSRERKLWEAHLDAGIGGTDWEVPEGAKAANVGARAGAVAGGCFLPPTVPMVMTVQHAGYTERGGMLNGVLAQPAMGLGMACTVLPAGTRVTMEFWGEPGDAEVMEIGFPTFVVPGRGAVQPRPVAGMPADASNRQLPDHLSGWVATPTFSLDAGDTVTLHLRGQLDAIH